MGEANRRRQDGSSNPPIDITAFLAEIPALMAQYSQEGEEDAVAAVAQIMIVLRDATIIDTPRHGILVGNPNHLPDHALFKMPAPSVALHFQTPRNHVACTETLGVAWRHDAPGANYSDDDEGLTIASIRRIRGRLVLAPVWFFQPMQKKPELIPPPSNFTEQMTVRVLRPSFFEDNVQRGLSEHQALGYAYGETLDAMRALYNVSSALRRELGRLEPAGEPILGGPHLKLTMTS